MFDNEKNLYNVSVTSKYGTCNIVILNATINPKYNFNKKSNSKTKRMN